MQEVGSENNWTTPLISYLKTSKEMKSEALEKKGDGALTRKEEKKKRALKQKKGEALTRKG